MSESLREQQKQLARRRIVEAAAEEVVAVGLSGFAVPAVAKRAGVSLRTVYNYYETKEALLEAVQAAANERITELGGVDLEPDMQRLPDAIRRNWIVFGQLGVLGEASSRIVRDASAAEGQVGMRASNTALSRAMRDGLAELAPDLDDAQIAAVAAVVRNVVSFDAWHRLTHEFGIDPEASGEVTAWAFAALRDALAQGGGPFA